MAVYTSNITIYTGTDFSQTFILEDDLSGQLMDLTGYSACAQMKRHEKSKTSISFETFFNNQNRKNGRVTISLTAANTVNINPGRYFYDILLNSPKGATTRVLEGEVIVKKAVTR